MSQLKCAGVVGSIAQFSFLISFILAKRTKEEMEEALKGSKLIPELLHHGPEHPLQVVYTNVTIDFGSNVTSYDLIQRPTISWPYEKSSLYCLILSSPDYPAYHMENKREWIYWLIGNIRENALREGYALTPYEPPGLSFGPHPRRFLFTVYKQPLQYKALHFDPSDRKREGLERSEFLLANFTRKHNLTELVAANFFVIPTLAPVMREDFNDPIVKREQRPKKLRPQFPPRDGDRPFERRGNFGPRSFDGASGERRNFRPRNFDRSGERRDFGPRNFDRSGERRDFGSRDSDRSGERRGYGPRNFDRTSGERRGFGPRRYGPERYGPERYGPERFGDGEKRNFGPRREWSGTRAPWGPRTTEPW